MVGGFRQFGAPHPVRSTTPPFITLKPEGEIIMAYVFSNQIVGKIKVTDDQDNDITLSGINGRETDANIIMGGVSLLFDIVGWQVTDAARTITQDIQEE